MAGEYALDPVLDSLLEPFEKWADTGYAEGVVDFLPSLGREPLLISPATIGSVFEAAGHGLDPHDADESSKAEFARRFDFIERLFSELMTRENRIRDRYYAARNRGMIHRTAVLLCAIGIFTIIGVKLPTWAAVAAGGSMICAGVVTYLRLSRGIERVRSIYVFEDRAARIVAALPWMKDRERISPRPPLEGETRCG